MCFGFPVPIRYQTYEIISLSCFWVIPLQKVACQSRTSWSNFWNIKTFFNYFEFVHFEETCSFKCHVCACEAMRLKKEVKGENGPIKATCTNEIRQTIGNRLFALCDFPAGLVPLWKVGMNKQNPWLSEISLLTAIVDVQGRSMDAKSGVSGVLLSCSLWVSRRKEPRSR